MWCLSSIDSGHQAMHMIAKYSYSRHRSFGQEEINRFLIQLVVRRHKHETMVALWCVGCGWYYVVDRGLIGSVAYQDSYKVFTVTSIAQNTLRRCMVLENISIAWNMWHLFFDGKDENTTSQVYNLQPTLIAKGQCCEIRLPSQSKRANLTSRHAVTYGHCTSPELYPIHPDKCWN